MHDHRLMHRDIKPDNVMVGLKPDDREKIFLCDFGLAKYWCKNRKVLDNREHIDYREGKKDGCGTLRYMSNN